MTSAGALTYRQVREGGSIIGIDGRDETFAALHQEGWSDRESISWYPTVRADFGCGACLRYCQYAVFAPGADAGVEVADPFRFPVAWGACVPIGRPGAISFALRPALDPFGSWNGDVFRETMFTRAHLTSDWLKQYIRDRGGVLNVTTRPVIAG